MKKSILLFTSFLLSLASFAQKNAPSPYGVIPSQQQRQWEDLESYGFIHFGINTFTNKEWGYGDEDPKLFNPKNFDAEQIVKTFKDGGFKGVILTCKHHDGFCLWPTKTTEHNITKSPFRNGKGDLVREVSDACKKYGLKFGVYLSPWDRNAANYGTPEYVKMYEAQLTELLTQYGDVFETWHDGANGGDGFYGGAKETRTIDRSTYYNWPNIWNLIEKLQPNAVIFGDIGKGIRWVGNETGFAGNPCWATFTPMSKDSTKAPSNGTIKNWLSVNGTRNGTYWMPAETDFSIRPGWFWHEKENNKVKTAKDLWNHYLLSVGRGASMLLNVPPDRTGNIYKTDAIEMAKFGKYKKDVFSTNLMDHATISASNVRGNSESEFGAKNLIDHNKDTYWATDDQITNPTIAVKLPKKQTFNLIRFKEYTPLGQRVDSLNVSAFIDQKWILIGGVNSIGIGKILVLPEPITTDQLKISVIKAAASPALNEIALFLAPNMLATSNANQYVKQHKSNWKIINSKNRAAIDNHPESIYTSPSNSLLLDLGKIQTLKTITYFPDNKNVDGLISNYILYTSNDLKNWKKASQGEFANIQSNPISQEITLDKPTKARYIKLVAEKLIQGTQMKIGEISVNNDPS